jgi:hypothetical protein
MEKLISKETESNLTKLGLYQIVGGVVGLIIIGWNIFKAPIFTGFTLLIYLFIILFFSYSIFCGRLCLKINKNALGHSITNQILQLFGFAIMGFAFKYVAGIYLTIGLNLTDSFVFSFGAGISKFNFNFHNEANRLEVDFNLIAFALIYWIDKLMKKVKEPVGGINFSYCATKDVVQLSKKVTKPTYSTCTTSK